MNDIILLGEIHGTKEIPFFVIDFLKKNNYSSFALEIPSRLQKAVDKRDFNDPWFEGIDGRGLSYKLLLQNYKGKVYCFDSDTIFFRRKSMAKNLLKLKKPLIVLTGNYHAYKNSFFNNLYKELTKKVKVKSILIKPLSGTFYNLTTRKIPVLKEKGFDEILTIRKASSVR